MPTHRTYLIHKNYLVAGEGWRHEEEILEPCTYEEAAQKASHEAHNLDKEHGNSHYWNVVLKSPDGGAYFELFHGRLS